MMLNLFQTIAAEEFETPIVVNRRYGFIETEDDRLKRICFRPWPKLISSTEVAWLGGWNHSRAASKRCRIYFNQPLAHPKFLTIAYIESTLGSSFRNLYLALKYIDVVAMRKRSDAILCEITNRRISDRAMFRIGYERHLENSRKRHFIKRFYGDYSSVELAGAGSDILPT